MCCMSACGKFQERHIYDNIYKQKCSITYKSWDSPFPLYQMSKAKNKVALLIKCFCATFIFKQYIASLYTKYFQSSRSQGQAVLLKEQVTIMALNPEGEINMKLFVIWARGEGWRRGQSWKVTGGWRKGRWRRGTTYVGYSSPHYGASRAAPHSPWTSVCSPLTPSEETPAGWPALRTAVCEASTAEMLENIWRSNVHKHGDLHIT